MTKQIPAPAVDAYQPGARLQYEDWKHQPRVYREPTHEDWLKECDELQAQGWAGPRNFGTCLRNQLEEGGRGSEVRLSAKGRHSRGLTVSAATL
jgi:hypothetical protein